MRSIEERFEEAIDVLFDENQTLAAEVAKLGYPKIVEGWPDTAGVGWDDDRGKISFMFNRKFAEVLDDKEFRFVVAHEAMHVINMHVFLFFNKAEEMKDKKKSRAEIENFINRLNVAADCVVNDSLTRLYGLERLKTLGYINDSKGTPRKCEVIYGINTVKAHTEDMTAMEVFYLLPKRSGQENSGHMWKSFLNSDGSFKKEFIEKIKGFIEKNIESSELSTEESIAVDKMLDSLKDSSDRTAARAGTTTKSEFAKISKFGDDSINWIDLVRNLTETTKARDNWNRPPRSLSSVYPDVILPSIKNEEVVDLFLAIDTSQSIDMPALQLFLNVARNTPKQFKITAINFDTRCYPYDIKTGNAQGRGGTNFQIIEDYIIKNLKKYPKAVVVLTDGEGTVIKPKYPQRWCWLLYGRSLTRYIKGMQHHDIQKLLR